MNSYRLTLALALAAGLFTLNGCVRYLPNTDAPAGTISTLYARGEMRSIESIPYEKAWNAMLRALKTMDYKVADVRKDAVRGRLTARQSLQDKNVTIKLMDRGNGLTEIRIYVGVFGDEARSSLILRQIREQF